MLKIEIKTGNSATNNPYELGELLKEVAEKIQDGRSEGNILDYNGNKVGKFKVEF